MSCGFDRIASFDIDILRFSDFRKFIYRHHVHGFRKTVKSTLPLLAVISESRPGQCKLLFNPAIACYKVQR